MCIFPPARWACCLRGPVRGRARDERTRRATAVGLRAVLCGVALCAVSLPSAAAWADGDLQVATGRVSAGTVVAGQRVTFGGSGFRPDTPIALTVEGVSVGSVTTDGAGSFSASLAPAGAPGFRTLAGTGAGRRSGTRVVTVTVQLVPAAQVRVRAGDDTPLGLLVGWAVVAVAALARVAAQRMAARVQPCS